MNRRLVAFVMMASTVALVSGGALLFAGRRLVAAELSDVSSQISAREWSWSRQRLADLATRAGGAEARPALVLLSSILDPALPLEIRDGDRVAMGRLPMAALLQRALTEERYEGCLRATALLAEVGLPSFPEYRAAALLELGRIDESRLVSVAASPGTRVRRRLREALAANLSTVLVRDREGALLGEVSPAAGGFAIEEGVGAGIVPSSALAGLGDLVPARSVRLTLDLDLSRRAQKALGSYRGSIVVVDPVDGSVLAAVSDRRTAAGEGSAALEQLREPASIAKLITVTAALRAGIDVESVLADMVCRGSLDFPQGPLYCSAVNGKLLGLDRAMAVSCNVAFAHLGSLIGREALVEEFRRYGYDPADGDRCFGRVLRPAGTERELGELSIGLEASAITPVHAALQAATVANGGTMHRPRLVRATDTFLGFSERLLPVEPGWQVIEPGWAPTLESAMVAVAAPGGTAGRVAPSSFPIALKTGTASEPGTGFHVNYIGFGPVPDARFAFAVRITHQRTSKRVRNAAYAVTKRFLHDLEGWDRAHGAGRGTAPVTATAAASS